MKSDVKGTSEMKVDMSMFFGVETKSIIDTVIKTEIKFEKITMNLNIQGII